MAELIVPPSPSWYLSSILACSDDGKTLAYGARHEIVLLKITESEDGSCDIQPSFIPMAHKDRVTAVALPPSSAETYTDHAVSSSDDGTVRVWNFSSQTLRFSHSGHPEGHKLPSLDWSRADPNLIVSVSDMGSIVCWDLISNTIRRLYAGTKVLPVCVACSPHNRDIIAVGAKHGLIIVYSIKGDGEQVFRLRGHETDVVSLAFCPKPYNVFKDKSENVHLLVSGSKDRCVYFWKTGTDGRLEYSINLPQAPMSGHRNRNGALVGPGNSWISVSWPTENIVFTSSLFGELLAYDIKALALPPKGTDAVKKKAKPILVHGIHLKGLFSIAASKKDDDIKVWTSALDKHIICTKYKDLKVICNITTIGGIVYCMAASPLDPYRIAIGSGDNKINIWNMSSPQSEGMQTYWSKINSKVMALAWHPVMENLIAFGTGEGRVGLLDVSGSKQPTLLRLYHRKCIYSLIWAPPVIKPEGEDLKFALFSVGDGEIAQYNPDVTDKDPESLQDYLAACDSASSMSKTLIRTDLAFNHDRSLAAIGNENGSVYVVTGSGFEYVHTIFAHKKLVQCIAWHPATVTSESCHSQYSSWLASASDNIQIVSITQSSVETIKSLGDHCEKVVSLMWSPHINGRLITASYDYTSQIWDVVQGTMISWLEGHHGAVVCCMFSPINPDMAITGSADYTIRVWDMNKHSDITNNVSSKNKKQRLKGAKIKFEGAQQATELNPADGSEYKSVKNATSEISAGDKKEKAEGDKTSAKRRQASMFPVTSLSMTSAKHIDVLWDRIKSKDKISSETKEDKTEESDKKDTKEKPAEQNGHVNGTSSPTPSVEETGYLDFFGDDKSVRRLLAVEETHHLANANFQNAMHASLWTGEISEVIYEAMKKKQLNDWLVSLAPLVSYKLWVECCTSYAHQLLEKHSAEGQGLKAASYLLAVHKVEEAVECLITCKLPREAVVLAKCRLASDDPMVEKAMRAWISHCLQYGQHILAAHCLLSIGDRMGCVDLLSRSKDANTLALASDIASSIQSKDLAAIVAVRSVTLSLSNQDYEGAESTLLLHPNLKELNLWTKLCALVHNESRLDDNSGMAWLLGSEAAKTKCSIFKECLKIAQPLLPLCSQTLSKHIPSSPDCSSENAVWLYICGQLSLSVISFLEEKADDCINYIIKALNAAYCYQNYQRLSNKVFLQITPFIFPQGLCMKGSTLVESFLKDNGLSTEAAISSGISEKLEIHITSCAIYWLEYLLSQNHEDLSSSSEPLKDIFIRSSSAILQKDILAYFTNEVKIKSLEKQVAVAKLESLKNKTKAEDSDKVNGSVESEEGSNKNIEENIDSDKAALEASLEQLKAWKATFESTRCPTVNPFVVYCCMKDVLQQMVSKNDNSSYKSLFEEIETKWESLNA